MWTDTLFNLMANLSSTKTTFATFTAASAVNRGLTAAGFAVTKIKGFGKKRNMLLGEFKQKPNNITPKNYGPQWFVSNSFSPSYAPTLNNKKIAIIGGGLAGCHSAYQLAKRGFAVDIFDKNSALASEASGNTQGVLFHRLSHKNDSLSRFSLTAWLYANRLYQQLFSQGLLSANEGDFNGILQLNDSDDLTRYTKLKEHYKEAEWLQFLSPEQASQKAGVPLASSAIEFIGSGWLSPPAVCRALTQHASINILPNNEVIKLSQNSDNHHHKWQVHTTNTVFSNYYGVVIANSHSANALSQTKDLPLQCVRGQINHLPLSPNNNLALPQCTVCHAGYITPPINNTLSFGASFILNSKNTELTQQEHQANIQQQLQFLPSLSPLLSASEPSTYGRVGIRCTTPDYLPIVGSVVDSMSLEKSYHHIRHNAKANSDIPGQWLDGLYVLIGLGSRGLTYGALAADILASQINAEPMPSDRHLIKALSPARFAIKDIIRKQTTAAK
jgi:tRNA 5-methylaminomethyl-2-thiouridine biosynthesis bifunctional protein